MNMEHKCQKCGRTADEAHGLFSESLHQSLPGMWCWECYHKAVIQQSKPVFMLSIVGENTGCADGHCCEDLIEEAVYETADNIDQGIAIDPPIDGSYMSTFIVRNGQLYVRYADLRDLEYMDDEDKLAYLEALLKGMDFVVKRPNVVFDPLE
jgi:DNA-directed RNA polymerase subunit RPC12/RpoP